MSSQSPKTRSSIRPSGPATPQRRELLRQGLGLSLVPLSAAGLSACGGGNDSSVGSASFTLAVLPDTQFYARYATSAEGSQFARRFGSEPFKAQTQWIADNARAFNIAFTTHLGDVVDQQNKPDQWKVADAAMKVLEDAGQPYSILAGNHDVVTDLDYQGDQSTGTDAQRDLAKEPYLNWFGSERARRQKTFGGRDPSGFHEYHLFSAQGQQFLVLSLSWRVSDAGLAWAQSVLDKHPQLPAILVNHALLNIDKDGASPLETGYGKLLWERLIKRNDQIFLTLNGHFHGAAHLRKTNDFGHSVDLMVVDYQMAYQGGNGLMRLYEFDLGRQCIDILSFSPWVVKKPKESLNSFDQAVLRNAQERLTLPLNFAQRFARFSPNFGQQLKANEALLPQAEAAVLRGFTEQTPTPPRAPADANDYPKVESTAAHWRFVGGTAGQALPVGAVIEDLTGKNPLRRDTLNVLGVKNAELGDLQWSADKHHLSAAPGSVRFLNTDKNVPRLSYFLTQADAPLNKETFVTTGYTVEAFIKIDAGWLKARHAWMNVMTRDGQRGKLPGFVGEDPEASPLLFAVSSLREIQWEVVPEQSGTRGGKTNWSGEILADKWVHIAIVNDPKTRETVMYIEGAPVLRNTNEAPGLAALAGQPWVIGGGAWDGERADGFFGQLGEIRICKEALPPQRWLSARRA